MAKSNYKNGNIVKGCVTGIEKYGIFVNLDNYYSGLIHISEISDSFVRNIDDYVNVGETIYVKIIDIDEKESHIKLSIKNIDYRINKRKKVKIIEVGSGFGCLEQNLQKWIEVTESEINKKKIKKS